jgi:hypothetical protein
MQEILTAITYPVVWLICSYIFNMESGWVKLFISVTAAILVYVLVGMKLSHNKNKEGEED